MKRHGSTFAAGLLFAIGLGVSGMTQADKVIGFLDPLHGWDPSLGLVMAGAIAAHLVLYRLILRRPSPVYGTRFRIPTRTDLTPRLVGGAALFGVGWGLGGYCPGPGLVSAPSGGATALVFVGSMAAGMALFHVAETALAEQRAARAPSIAEIPGAAPARQSL